MRPIIRVENLGKEYRIGHRDAPYATLRESLTKAAHASFSRARQAYLDARDALRRPITTYHLPLATRSPSPDRFWALKDVSFEVQPGEVVGIIGRNGAGKSTLLKVLSRITEPTTGRADLYGRIGSLLEVGTGFHPELSGRENIYLNGAILGMTRREIDRRFDEIVDFAEVDQFIDTPVKRYSSGMYLRLAFAVAAHLETEILLVDEVLAVGDIEFQRKCLRKMESVAKLGRTVLFVSHNMNAVEDLCNSAMLLEMGQIREFCSDVRDVLHSYLFEKMEERKPSLWSNPGHAFDNPWFIPKRFFLSDSNGLLLNKPQRNDDDIWLHIEADIGAMDSALTVGYAVYNEAGSVVYWSYHTDGAPEEWPRLYKGRCVLRSQLPKRWLNEGTYRIELIGGLTFRQWLFEPAVSAPSVFLTIQGGLSDSPLWTSKRPGVLAPVFRWSAEKCGS